MSFDFLDESLRAFRVTNLVVSLEVEAVTYLIVPAVYNKKGQVLGVVLVSLINNTLPSRQHVGNELERASLLAHVILLVLDV